MGDNLAAAFHHVALARPERLALSVADADVSYGELARRAGAIAGWSLDVGGGTGRVAVMAGRSQGAYAGVLAACWAGGTYVPLGAAWPEARLAAALELVRPSALIVDAAGAGRMSPRLLAAAGCPVLVADWGAPSGNPKLASASALPDRAELEPAGRTAEHVAYVMFTSGTTGAPKGVQVSLGAVLHHLAVVQDVHRFDEADRISLAPELTFDPSILNMFMAWGVGASLHVVPAPLLIAPDEFIRDEALTVWNSAPTVIGLLMRRGRLGPGVFPSLRLSIFGGDTLTAAAAQAWRRAAPASAIENVYGPTEATIECLHYRLDDPPSVTRGRGSLALGAAYAGTRVAVLGEALNPVPPGETGELAISGPQLAVGYLGEPELTALRFPIIGGARWYLTGDLAYQDQAGLFHHLGRRDDQIKVRGNRVELGEVESCLRQVCETELAAAIGWPIVDGAAMGVVGFFVPAAGGPAPASREICTAMRERLPAYMTPQSVRAVAALPTTPHGKVDRQALAALLSVADG